MGRLRFRRALLRTLTAAIALALSVALAELMLRLIHFDFDYALKVVSVGEEWRDVHMFEQDMFESDPILLWKPKSSTNYYVPFNSYGYRGREVASPKDSKEFRILTIGDSNILGPAEYSWPGFLQNRFDVSCPDSRATVLNAGVYGYTSFQGIRRFEEGLRYVPDVVVIAFGWNDVVETTNGPDKTYGEKALRFAATKRFLFKNFRTYRLLHSAFLVASLRGVDKSHLTPRVSLTDYKSNLLQLVSKAKQKGILPLLLTRPNVVDTAAPYSNVQAWRRNLSAYNAVVREVAAESAVPLVDAYNMFAGMPRYFIDDNHLAESGAKRLADKVYSEIGLNALTCPALTFEEDYLPPSGYKDSKRWR